MLTTGHLISSPVLLKIVDYYYINVKQTDNIEMMSVIIMKRHVHAHILYYISSYIAFIFLQNINIPMYEYI